MKIATLAAGGALMAALAGAVGWAQGFGGGGHDSFGPFGLLALHHAVKELDLTPEQMGRVKAILRSHKGEFREITGRLHGVHESVRQETGREAVDESAIRERVGAALAPLGDLAVLHARVQHEIHAVLTPEQRQKAESLHERFKAHREQMRESFHELADDWLEDPS